MTTTITWTERVLRPATTRPTGMTAFQRWMLRYLKGHGATQVCGVWVWPEDVRRDERLAERLYWTLQ